MRSIESWLEEYGESHRHPANILIHKVAVPLIVWSVIGLLWSISWLIATIAGLAVTLFYFLLSRPLGFGMLFFLALEFLAVYWVDVRVGLPLWLVSVVIFIIAWILQFVGHGIEGKRPSFLKDLVFLLIGPAWVIAPVYRLLNIKL